MDKQTLEALHALFLAPRTVQSDFARMWAQEIACLASQGHITTKEGQSTFGRLWRVTPPGINQLIAHGLL